MVYFWAVFTAVLLSATVIVVAAIQLHQTNQIKGGICLLLAQERQYQWAQADLLGATLTPRSQGGYDIKETSLDDIVPPLKDICGATSDEILKKADKVK